MDFGVVGFENGGLVCSGNRGFGSAEDAESKQKWYGSGFLKQQRSVTATEDEDDDDDHCGLLKLPKTTTNTVSDDFFSPSKSMLTAGGGGGGTSTLLLRSHHFFSSDMLTNNNSQPLTFPYYHRHPYSSSASSSSSSSSSSIALTRNASAGCGSGGMLHGPTLPFTPSQWMELEHQALIYKYISANVPIPSYLLNPIRKAFDSAGFSTFTSLRPNSLGWGAFHLGFSNSSDPEPGRCRRTDGKKWRCSRDAITDHKYCERHMNRGRHRSRKPVEGQSGHSVSGTSNNTVKLMPVSSSASAAVVPGGGVASSIPLGLSSQQHQLNKIQQQSSNSNATTSATPHGNNRNFMNKECLGERYQDTTTTGLSNISPAIISMKENQYSISKQQNLYGESCRGEFGQVCSDSLLNPLNRSSSLVNCCNYGTSEDINDRESEPQRGFRQFMDDWPNSHYPERSWPDVEMHSDRTQLSISIPITTSDFMSSTSSPTNEKLTPSPLRLSREHDPTHMGLGVGCNADERSHRQANWIPISWGSSMGGPLGEVLHNANNSTGDVKNASSLNLMSEGWDSSPRLASSPTGVLQKAALVSSLSNSSAGSSPRAADNNKTHEGASLCSVALGSSLMNPMNPSFMNNH